MQAVAYGSLVPRPLLPLMEGPGDEARVYGCSWCRSSSCDTLILRSDRVPTSGFKQFAMSVKVGGGEGRKGKQKFRGTLFAMSN